MNRPTPTGGRPGNANAPGQGGASRTSSTTANTVPRTTSTAHHEEPHQSVGADLEGQLRRGAQDLAAAQQPQQHSQPPQEQGKRLATIPRGEGEELRVTWGEYQGHYFLSIRLWSKDRSGGGWWPVKGKGISIKPRELAAFAQGVLSALTEAKRHQPKANNGQQSRDRRWSR